MIRSPEDRITRSRTCPEQSNMNPHSIVKIISLCFFWIPICSVCKIREEKGTTGI
ncbi:hypothetical protein LEP1GSC040_0355 [Leptospira santarosai str. 2000030832]|nr:hypothetical protein LEP1GSC040_0355 [Leptospira santarosai str. 2000030832]